MTTTSEQTSYATTFLAFSRETMQRWIVYWQLARSRICSWKLFRRTRTALTSLTLETDRTISHNIFSDQNEGS